MLLVKFLPFVQRVPIDYNDCVKPYKGALRERKLMRLAKLYKTVYGEMYDDLSYEGKPVNKMELSEMRKIILSLNKKQSLGIDI